MRGSLNFGFNDLNSVYMFCTSCLTEKNRSTSSCFRSFLIPRDLEEKIDGDGNENWLNKRFNEQNNSSARAS